MKLEIPEQKKLVHSVVVPIRWGDMDAMGHVNNTLYFRYMEIARLDWFFQMGMPADPKGEGPVIANAFCNFIRQFEYPGDVLVRTYVGTLGRSSFDTFHEMLRTDDPDKVYANGGATVVWVDFPQQASRPLPQALRDQLATRPV
ncbi:thioesterase family protein [Hydrogenophaga sp.]|uniref:acyl-CoA thioesterase n=1 Tax=Hydrogenophaga sp. TaxID=1904254 RepID=UPI002722199F|nr:thioesterase family protein [Hydrogenophaga sp.]MDO8903700.1 thioesterase family protein [Hydrogenophaga sp.]